MILQYHITERCNLKCSHCYLENEDLQDILFTDFESALLQFKNLTEKKGEKKSHLHLTGGEPLYHPQFFDFLELLKSHSSWLTFAVLTNGTLINKSTAKKIAFYHPLFVQVSLDGGRKTHDQIRGAGSFKSSIQGIKNLKKAGIPVQISFTASVMNFKEFPKVVQTARRIRGIKVWSDRFIPMGRGVGIESAVLKKNELKEFFTLIAQERKKKIRNYFSKTKITANRALQFIVNKNFPYSCSAGSKLLAVLPDGTVYPCRRLPISAGNIKTQSLDQIYFENTLLLQMREKKEKKSEGCEKCSFFVFCKGGAKCMSFAISGDWRKKDPFCLY